MCKANSHAEDSNAKTLPNSCLEAARFAPENCGIHAEKSQYSCSKATIFMLEQHENHLQTPRKSRSKAADFTQKTNSSAVDPHGITRRRRFAPANSQRAARSRGGFRRHQTSPAPRVATPRRRPRINRATAPIGISTISQHRFTADCQHKPPDNAPHR